MDNNLGLQPEWQISYEPHMGEYRTTCLHHHLYIRLSIAAHNCGLTSMSYKPLSSCNDCYYCPSFNASAMPDVEI